MERMRKRIGRQQHIHNDEADEGWLELEHIATVEEVVRIEVEAEVVPVGWVF